MMLDEIERTEAEHVSRDNPGGAPSDGASTGYESRPRREAQPEIPVPPRVDVIPSPSEPKTRAATPPDGKPRQQKPRRAVLLPLGLLLLGAVVVGGYLYWDNASHFETTDDAFIAARQFAVAPKVAGYLTAVPVTDNQHVAAGDVIARIDNRDYLAALAQADAQVAAAQANLQGIDAQIDV